jgi:DedD protein
MRDLDQLREREHRGAGNEGRKLGLLALAGTLSVAAIISLGVVSGSSGEREVPAELDPLSQLVLSGQDPKAPPAAPKSAVQLEHLSFPATLGGDEAAIEAAIENTARSADAELAGLTGRIPRARARAEDVPASTLATGESDRLSRAAKHDPLIAQAIPERGGVVAPSGSEGAFTLQVVSYETRDAAERFANALRARGHRAFVLPAEVPGRGRSFRVRIGPFTTRRDALIYQTSFEREERMHSIVVTSPAK